MERILSKSKNYLLIFLILIPALLSGADSDSLKFRLLEIPQLKEYKPLLSGSYSEKYEFYITQPVNHKNPSEGSFRQRVFVMHIGYDRPTILVTEGYGGSYAASPGYREELSRMLNANVVFVEHRYFDKSTPQNMGWKYLTGENAAADLHRVKELFSKIYKGQWIATGISKGGQNSLIYTSYYPKDISLTVAYVAPLCYGVEEKRHGKFILEKPGTPADRAKVQSFQKEVLKRRASLMPKFDSLCKVYSYEFRIPADEVYDYSVLEFSFSFWQWGHKPSLIPSSSASDNEIFKYWINISSPDYFVKESPNTPFFIQAAKELGYYGYDIKPFKDLLKINSSRNYLKKIFLPEKSKIKFDKSLYKRVKRFIDTTGNRIIFVYGGVDPWSAASAIEQSRENVVLFVNPDGNHRSRINNLPEKEKIRAGELIEKWLSK